MYIIIHMTGDVKAKRLNSSRMPAVQTQVCNVTIDAEELKVRWEDESKMLQCSASIPAEVIFVAVDALSLCRHHHWDSNDLSSLLHSAVWEHAHMGIWNKHGLSSQELAEVHASHVYNKCIIRENGIRALLDKSCTGLRCGL
jgi:hypothetical protein